MVSPPDGDGDPCVSGRNAYTGAHARRGAEATPSSSLPQEHEALPVHEPVGDRHERLRTGGLLRGDVEGRGEAGERPRGLNRPGPPFGGGRKDPLPPRGGKKP